MSKLVEPLAPEPPMRALMASSPPGPRFSESRKNRCSNRWAKPVRPGSSRAEPTRAASTTATTGSERSMWKMTRRPFSSSKVWAGISVPVWAAAGADAGAAGSWVRASAATAPIPPTASTAPAAPASNHPLNVMRRLRLIPARTLAGGGGGAT